jgi:hypothetical protein
MPALALQSADDLSRLIPRQPESFMAQSKEAQKLSEHTSHVLSHLSKTKTYESAEIDTIKRLLQQGSGYASLSFITRKTGLTAEDFHELLGKTNQFKKSVIVTEDGDEVYRLNSTFGSLRDIWNAFCHLNAMKF